MFSNKVICMPNRLPWIFKLDPVSWTEISGTACAKMIGMSEKFADKPKIWGSFFSFYVKIFNLEVLKICFWMCFIKRNIFGQYGAVKIDLDGFFVILL